MLYAKKDGTTHISVVPVNASVDDRIKGKSDYTYDSLNRMSKKSLHIGDNVIKIDYAYKLSDRNTNGIETFRTRKLQREIIDKIS